MKKALLFIAALLPGLFIAEAQAAIAFRAASSAGVRTAAISYRGTGNVASAASGNVTPTLSSVSLNNLLLCLVEQHDNVAIAFPAGWTQLYTLSTTATHRASAYYKLSAGTETNPLVTHPGGDSITARCSTFRGADAVNPLDVAYAAQYAASSASVTSGSVTTLTANDWVLFAPHIAFSPTIAAPTGAGGVTWTQQYYSSTTLGLDTAVGLYTGTKATAGAVGPITSALSNASESHGVLMALHDGSRLSINVPAGTVVGDVMIAAIATTPSSVPITAPAGWTLIRAVTQTTTTSNRVSTYYRVATAGEPASYTWTLSTTHAGAAGGIVSYSGVDTSNPVDVSAGAATASSLSHAAPSITPTVAGDMLVTVHAYASASSWTPPAGMTERVDMASRSANNAGVTLEMNDLPLATTAATGTKTATAASNADTGGTVSIALRPLVVAPHHIRIEHDGSASNCAPESITLKACANASCTAPHYTATDVTGINLSPTTGGYTWSPSSTVSILAANGGISSGITLARASNGTAVLAITGTSSPAPSNAYECYNTATNTSGDCNLIYSGNFSFDVPNHVAGNRQTVILTACTANFANTTRTVKFWSSYVNPAVGSLTGKIVAGGTGNADCVTGYSSLATSSGSPTSLSLSFGAGTAPQASFSLCYPDVGEVRLDARYDGAAGNTPPDAGVVILGNDIFIAKPDHFTVSAVKCTTANAANCGAGALPSGNNPAATDQTGGAFMRAGDATQPAARFSATVTAKNALDAATPNFGQESTPEGVKLTAVLLAPAGGDPGVLSCKASSAGCIVLGGATNFSSGATTITDLAWDDVGIIQIMPKVADADYLGTGEVGTPTASGNIGRFIPDHFTVNPDAVNPIRVRAGLAQNIASATGSAAGATVINVDATTGFNVGSRVRIPGGGAGGNAFVATVTAVDPVGLTLTLDAAIGTALLGGESVIDEWGGYTGETMNAQFDLSAINLAGNTTLNYQGLYAKLNPAAAGNPLVLGAVNAGLNLTARLDTSTPAAGSFAMGVAGIVLPFSITRAAAPHAPYTALQVGIAPADSDGVRMGAYDLNVGGTNDHTSLMDPLVQGVVELRHGRFRIPNAYGSERLALPMSATAQYFNGTTWVSNLADNLTSFSSDFSPAGNLLAAIVTGLGGGLTASNPDALPVSSGVKNFRLAAPNVSGSADISLNAPAYLPSAPGRATFGIYRSPLIYRRENY